MFNFFKKRPSVVGIADTELVTALLNYILHDSTLSRPVYLPGVLTEADAENTGIAPLVIVWNEDQLKGSFSVSINKSAIEHLLEGALPAEHENFVPTRNEIIKALNATVPVSIVKTCEKFGVLPSKLYALNPTQD